MPSKPVELILSRLENVKHSGKGWSARCPAHHDRHNSLSINEGKDGRALLKCHVGCEPEDIVKAVNLTMRDLHESKPLDTTQAQRLTVEELAIAKGISSDFLKSLGVYEDDTGVIIPFRDKDGKLAREQKRISLTGQRFCWKGAGKIVPYGIWLFDESDMLEKLFIAEGTSDCWTLLYKGYNSLGIPGNNMAKVLTADHIIQGIHTLYLIEQNDEGGKTFIANMLARLNQIGWQGKTFIIKIGLAGKGLKDINDLLRHDKERFHENFTELINKAEPPAGEVGNILKPEPAQPQQKSQVVIYTLADLQRTVFPEPKWAVDGILPQGLIILAAKPKMGKTCLMVGISLAISYGSLALGQIPVVQGEVLYLALEESQRRLQEKIKLLMVGEETSWPANFHFATKWKQLESGGLEDIEAWLKKHPNARLVVIDTLAKVRSPSRKGENIYERDYASMQGLIALTNEYNVAILANHHLRKYADVIEDPLEAVSGSMGLTGAVDTVLVLKRERGRQDAVLNIMGRDIEEKSLALQFKFPYWTLLGNAEEYRLSQERQAILAILREAKQAMSPKEVWEQFKVEYSHSTLNSVSQFLFQMSKQGLIKALERGQYSL